MVNKTQTVTSQITQNGDDLWVYVTLTTDTGGERDSRARTTAFHSVDAMMRYRDELQRRIDQARALGVTEEVKP